MQQKKPKHQLHPRNVHRDGYDFAKLVQACPALSAYVSPSPAGQLTIDFSDPKAVLLLNKSLLADAYGYQKWSIPEGSLCPPVPGRADYVHYLADLLGSGNGGRPPRGGGVQILDIGVGANGIYPILGRALYGWSFHGVDISPEALQALAAHLAANPHFKAGVSISLQQDPGQVLKGAITGKAVYDAVACNPPFYASAAAAAEENERKWRKLGKAAAGRNFAGQAGELWCEGGERGFITRYISESRELPTRCFWYTTLVSRSAHLPYFERLLNESGANAVHVQPMGQGQKVSHMLCWTYLSAPLQRDWARFRWQ